VNLDLLINFIQSFIIGALAVSTVSITADRFGSRLAGVLAGFPVTVAASLYYQARPPAGALENAVEATTAIPLMMGFFGLFLAFYCWTIPSGLMIGLGVSLGGWALLTALVVMLGPPAFIISVIVFVACVIASFYITEKVLVVPARRGQRVTLRTSQLLARCFSGGAVVGGSYLVGQMAGAVLGGIMAAFPAVTVSTLIVTYQSGGPPFSAAVAKSMMLSGMINVSMYSIAVRFLYPEFGLLYGTLLAFLVACTSSYFIWLFIERWTS